MTPPHRPLPACPSPPWIQPPPPLIDDTKCPPLNTSGGSPLTARLRLRFARYFPRRTSSGAGCSRLYFTNLSLLQPQHSPLLMKRFPHRSGCLGQIFPRCCRAVRVGVVIMRHSTTTRGPCQ